MAAIAASMGLDPKNPNSTLLARTTGSNLGFLGSRPRAVATIGSSLGFLGSIPKAASNIGSRVGVADLDLSPPLLVAGWAMAPSFLGSIPIACNVLESMERAAIIIGSIFIGFLGSPRPSMAAVMGSKTL